MILKGKSPKHSLESGPDGCHVPVQAAFGPADVQGQWSLEQAGEDLDLIRTAVLGYFKPLHQKLRKRDRHTMPPLTSLNFKPYPQTPLFETPFSPSMTHLNRVSLLAVSTWLQSFPRSQQQEIQTATDGTFRRNTHLYPDVMWGHLRWTGPWLALFWGCQWICFFLLCRKQPNFLLHCHLPGSCHFPHELQEGRCQCFLFQEHLLIWKAQYFPTTHTRTYYIN